MGRILDQKGLGLDKLYSTRRNTQYIPIVNSMDLVIYVELLENFDHDVVSGNSVFAIICVAIYIFPRVIPTEKSPGQSSYR